MKFYRIRDLIDHGGRRRPAVVAEPKRGRTPGSRNKKKSQRRPELRLLRLACLEPGLTLTEVAERSGLSRGTCRAYAYKLRHDGLLAASRVGTNVPSRLVPTEAGRKAGAA